MKRAVLILFTALSLGALSACETATPYQPVASGNAQSGGYSETRLEANRWRVTFQGNTLTSRSTVENYLLNRAAELTVAQGFDWFETTDRNTDKKTETYVTPDPWGYGYGWHPYWRYYGRHGWVGYGDPFFGDPFYRGPFHGGPYWGPDVETTQRYEASAEVVMGHGPKPAGDRRAFDAREVITNLGPHIVRPK
jgi:hypothetical protein